MRIELVIEESGETIAEDGTTFMEAAGKMILTLDGLFGGEPDASIFEAFSALASGEREFTSRDFSTPEQNFTLRVLGSPEGSPEAPEGGASEPMEPGEPELEPEEWGGDNPALDKYLRRPGKREQGEVRKREDDGWEESVASRLIDTMLTE